MVAPATVRFIPRPSPIPRAPLSVAVIDEDGTMASVAMNTLTRITESNKATLGTDGPLRSAYDHITQRANVQFWALPVAITGTPATDAPLINAAIDLLDDASEREKLDGFPPDLVVVVPAGAAHDAADAAITGAAGHEVSTRATFFSDASAATGYTDPAAPTLAEVDAFNDANSHPGVLLALNDGGDADVPGRFLLAEHYIRYFGQQDIGVNPIGVSFHAADITEPAPHFGWGIEDATADANVLIEEHGAVFVSYAGDVFVWGGKIDTDTVLDTVGHRLVSKRMAEQTIVAGLPLVGQRVTLDQREGLQTQVQDIAAVFVDLGEAASMDVHLPRVESARLKHAVTIRFYDTVEAYELDVEVGHVEV